MSSLSNFILLSSFWLLALRTCGFVCREFGKDEQGEKFISHINVVHDYCRTSADLFKTVFDLLVSVTVFVGRFDMRMMQVYYL